MRPKVDVYVVPTTTLDASETDIDVFQDDSYLRRNYSEVPAGAVWLIKDLAFSETAGTAPAITWRLMSGNLELARGVSFRVSAAGALDLNFVPDLNIPLPGGTKLSLICTSTASLAGQRLHISIHEYSLAEYAAAKAEGASEADL